MARPGHDVALVLLLRSHVVVRVRFRLCCAPFLRLPARLARYVHIHELSNSWGQRPATRLLQHHAGGHAIRHYPGRSAGGARVHRQGAGQRGQAGVHKQRAGPHACAQLRAGVGSYGPLTLPQAPLLVVAWGRAGGAQAWFPCDSGPNPHWPGFWAPCSPTPPKFAAWEAEAPTELGFSRDHQGLKKVARVG